MLCQEGEANAPEQLTMLQNGTVIREVKQIVAYTFSDKGQDQLKNMRKAIKRQLASKELKGHKAADTLRCLSNALEAGHGHGLEVYMPATRLLPGKSMVLDPPGWTDRPFLKLLVGKAGSSTSAYNYLLSVAGLRGCLDTDRVQRMDSNAVLAVKKAGLYPALLKCDFIGSLNKGSWPGRRLLATQQEALAQYLWSVTQDPAELAVHLQGTAFDIGQSLGSANYTLDVLLTAGKWLDMGISKGTSAGLEPNHSCSFVNAFSVLNTEWTGIRTIMQWMLEQLGNWKPDNEVVKEHDKLQAAATAQAKAQAKAGTEAEVSPVVVLAEASVQADIDQTWKQVQQQTYHTLKLCLSCMSSRKLQVEGRIISAYLRLGQMEMAESIKQHKSQADSVAWYADQACHAGLPMLRLISEVCDDVTWLESLMLTMAVPPHSSAHEDLGDEVVTAEQALQMAVEYMSLTAWTAEQYASTFPWQLAGSMHSISPLAAWALDRCNHAWECIKQVEGWLAEPGAETKWPSLWKLMVDLDFHKHQLVRELCHSLDLGDPAKGLQPWSSVPDDVRMQLWHMLGTPANTTAFIEDTFYDASQANQLTHYSSDRFLRMQHVIMAGINRAHQFGMPAVAVGPGSAACHGNITLPNNTLPPGYFVPPSSKAKAEASLEHGCPLDVGISQGNQHPLIDLQPLLRVKPSAHTHRNAMLPQHRGKRKKRGNGAEPDLDTDLDDQQAEPRKDIQSEAEAAPDAPAVGKKAEANWTAASSDALFRSASAMKQVLSLQALFGGANTADEAERLTQLGWMAVLLAKGCCYMYQDSSGSWLRFVSLGFYGYSTSCWLLSSVEVETPDGTFKTMMKLSGWQADEKEDSAPTPLFHMCGSQVDHLYKNQQLYAINTEIALPCMTGGNGLGWFCHTDLEDVILFGLQKGLPLSTAQLMLLAHMLRLKLPRGAEQQEAISVARALLCKLFPDMMAEVTDVVLRKFYGQVDPIPTGLPPTSLADPSLLDILLQMQAQLPDGLPNDLQSVLAATHHFRAQLERPTNPMYKASQGKHNELACINQCSGPPAWGWSTSMLSNDWAS